MFDKESYACNFTLSTQSSLQNTLEKGEENSYIED